MTSSDLFGTDGIRGVAGEFPLDRSTVVGLGQALAQLLRRDTTGRGVLLAGDTRPSTPEIAGWLAAGLESAGTRVRWAGTLPTPAVALLVRQMGLDAGIAVSASHNPAADNGIKLFDRRGRKWERARERELEALLASRAGVDGIPTGLLKLKPLTSRQYLDYLIGLLPSPETLAGLRVVIDAAHGAAAPLLPELAERLGLDAVLLNASADGSRINDGCGSTHPHEVADAVRRERADLGWTFDGDADRVLLADADGRVRDGDALLYLWALELQRQGRLQPAAIVATSMSNLGLERALARQGIEVVRCDVGDREVAATLEDRGLILGGEQSGHLLNRNLSSTGDGLLTALQMAAIVCRRELSLAELLADLEIYPQVLRNVPAARKVPLDALPALQSVRHEVEAELGREGRLLLRYSGTEPLARIMIEGPDQAQIEGMAERLAEAIAAGVEGGGQEPGARGQAPGPRPLGP